MTFTNEFVSKEDIAKYDLDALWRRHLAFERNGTSDVGYVWTIDRDRNVFLLPIERGREEFSGQTRFVLSINGQEFDVKVALSDGSSKRLDERPFKRVWSLVSMTPKECAEQKNVISNLKQALSSYGYFGVHMQIPNTLVTFNF